MNKNSNPLNLAHLNVLELAPPDVIAVAETAGFRTAGLRLSPARPEETPPPVYGDTPMRRDLISRIEDSGVGILEIELLWLRRQTELRSYEPFLELGALLGAKNVITCCDTTNLSEAQDMFEKACDMAAPYKLNMNLEFLPWIGIGRFDQALTIVTKANRRNGKMMLDPLHLSRTGVSFSRIAEVDTSLIAYAQICDAPLPPPVDMDAIAFEAKFERMLPGQGDLPLGDYVSLLPAGIPLSVEVAFPIRLGLTAYERASQAMMHTTALLNARAE